MEGHAATLARGRLNGMDVPEGLYVSSMGVHITEPFSIHYIKKTTEEESRTVLRE
jgi:hypothetical protein